MGFQSMKNMGSTVTSYVSNQIYINGAAVPGFSGTYTPGSTITVSLSPYAGQLVFQANSGAVFKGSSGKRNVNGIISGCTTVSRYQMYSSTTALLVMPASGTVTIECNFASTSGSHSVKIPRPIVLTPASSSSHKTTSTVVPTLQPVMSTSSSVPSFKPTESPLLLTDRDPLISSVILKSGVSAGDNILLKILAMVSVVFFLVLVSLLLLAYQNSRVEESKKVFPDIENDEFINFQRSPSGQELMDTQSQRSH
jgi:hypothetical protein